MGGLNSKKIFFFPAMAPASFNVVMIAAIFGLTGYLKTIGVETIYALGAGVLIGGLTQFFVQLPSLLKNGYTISTNISLLSPQVKRIIARLESEQLELQLRKLIYLLILFWPPLQGLELLVF